MATHEVSVRRLIFANLPLQHSYHDEHRVDATLTNGWSTISQSVSVRVTVDGELIHNQLGHRTVAQVDVHVRRSGQLAAIELGESHCSGLRYVYWHSHDHEWSTELALGWGFGLRHLCFAWVFHFRVVDGNGRHCGNLLLHRTISHHLDYVSQVAGVNII